jgi:hypothetical protein
MTTPISYPLLNGVRHSFSSIELKINGVIYQGFKSINYNRTRTRGMARGNSPDPLGKTRGENEYKADCELYLAEWNLLQAGLGAGYGDVSFTVICSYTENGFDVITDELQGCTLDDSDAANSQGVDPTVRKCTLSPIKILFNGIDDLETPLTGVAT